MTYVFHIINTEISTIKYDIQFQVRTKIVINSKILLEYLKLV